MTSEDYSLMMLSLRIANEAGLSYGDLFGEIGSIFSALGVTGSIRFLTALTRVCETFFSMILALDMARWGAFVATPLPPGLLVPTIPLEL